MRLKEENPELNGIVKSYNLRGFSFREYLNLSTGEKFRSMTLEEIMSDKEKLVQEITAKVNPLEYFENYIKHGFYPLFREHDDFSENLLKSMNMMTEIDILLLAHCIFYNFHDTTYCCFCWSI